MGQRVSGSAGQRVSGSAVEEVLENRGENGENGLEFGSSVIGEKAKSEANP